jgi:hypothetical protein
MIFGKSPEPGFTGEMKFERVLASRLFLFVLSYLYFGINP